MIVVRTQHGPGVILAEEEEELRNSLLEVDEQTLEN
jgi:hypothetical protein